jgi:hypothetical protein
LSVLPQAGEIEIDLSGEAQTATPETGWPFVLVLVCSALLRQTSSLKRYIEALGGKLSLDVELADGRHIGITV